MTACHEKDNLSHCSCTYDPCSRKGRCCECIAYHRGRGELPGCLFPPKVEKSHDRSRISFCQSHGLSGRSPS